MSEKASTRAFLKKGFDWIGPTSSIGQDSANKAPSRTDGRAASSTVLSREQAGLESYQGAQPESLVTIEADSDTSSSSSSSIATY